jgi:anaerobic ribonucleoside-triphosphate reductase activating protein
MADPLLNLARVASPVTSLGPGRRLVLWVAGCPLDCPGCISPELRDPAAGKPIAVERLADYLLGREEALDGVTLSGGEPFAQAGPLARLWQLLSARRPQWNLLVFTGHTERRLRQWPAAQALLDCTDLLIAGPYRADLPCDQPLLASANQRVVVLSERGRRMAEDLRSLPVAANLAQDRDGRGWLVGVLDPDARQRLHQRLGVTSSLRPLNLGSTRHG